MPILSCRFCACEFSAKTDRKMYCSPRCKDKGKPSASGLTCRICNGSMVKGPTSLPQGEAAHNRCMSGTESSYGAHGMGGYGRGCRCDICRGAKNKTQARLAKRYFDEHGHWRESRWISRERRTALYERDGWNCQICKTPVDASVHYLNPAYPTLDHIVPVSMTAEPDHSDANLRTAHRICNAVRSDRVAITDEEVASRASLML